MNMNKWTLGLAAVGLISLPSVSQAEEKSNSLMTALSSTTISGYVNTSAQYGFGTQDANPAPVSYNGANKQDGFNLNTVDLTIEKGLDEGKWSAGYKVELWFGPDATALGNTLGGSEVALKQGYVALRAPVGNGIDFKMGTFDTIIGYEVANAGSNPNFTRSYGYTIEPTQHTGLLASYQFTKEIGIAGGVANTLTPGTAAGGINNRVTHFDGSPSFGDPLTYMAAISLVAPDGWGWAKGSQLYGGIVYGWADSSVVAAVGNHDNGAGVTVTGDTGGRQANLYGGLTLNTPWNKLKVGLSYDYAAGQDANAYHATAAALYASVQLDQKFSVHARAEYYQGSKEVFASGLTEAYALTGTLQYDLWANVLSRLEIRWDHSLDGDGYGGSTVGAPQLKNAVLVALNVIYKF